MASDGVPAKSVASRGSPPESVASVGARRGVQAQKVLQQIPTSDGTLVESEAPRLCPRIRYNIDLIFVGACLGEGHERKKIQGLTSSWVSKIGRI